MATANLTAERLRELLHYDPDTGLFVWRLTRGSMKAGKQAGSPMRTGHIAIGVDGSAYLAHRLAFLYLTGDWPAENVDHRNGAAADNRFSNLRSVGQAVNTQNLQRARRDSKSGLLGVMTRKEDTPLKYRARITVGGTIIRLGSYATPEEAHMAYINAKRQLHVGCTI